MSIRLKSSAGVRTIPQMTDLWQFTSKQLSDVDLNTISDPGIYFMNGSSGVTNRPAEISGGLIVLPIHTADFAQIFVGATGSYIRVYSNSEFKSWKQITLTGI